jgi:hypothetical protein
MFYRKDFMDIANNFSTFHGYNEHFGNFSAKLMEFIYSKTQMINFKLLKI